MDKKENIIEDKQLIKSLEKKHSADLMHLNGVLKITSDINQAIIRIDGRDLLLKEISKILISNHTFDSVWIALYDKNAHIYKVIDDGFGVESLVFKEKLLNGFQPYCIEHINQEKLLSIDNSIKSCGQCILKNSYKEDVASVLSLKYKDKIYGNIGLSMKREYLHNERDNKLLIEVAENIAFALFNIEMSENKTETEKALRESERKSQAWIQNSPVCTKIIDLDFNLQFMSASGIRELNIDNINEYYGKPYPFDFYPDAAKVKLTSALKKAKKTGEIIAVETLVLDIDGNNKHYESTVVPVNNDTGELDYLLVVSSEISKQKEAENLLRLERDKQKQGKEQLKTLFSNLPGMAYRVKNDRDWSVLFLSDNCKELTGYEVEDFMQNKRITFNELIHVDDREYVWNTVQNAIMARQSFELEYRMVMADGTLMWMWEQGVGIFEDNELLYLDGIVLDNEKRFHMLFENSEVSIWNEDLTEVVKSLEELRKAGVTDIHKHLTQNIKLAQEIAIKVNVFDVNNATVKLFNADSKEQFISDVSQTFGDDAILVFIEELTAIWEKREFFTKEALFKTLDGKVIHGIVTFQIPKQLEQFSSISVNILDITNLKKAEKELETTNNILYKSEEKLRNLLDNLGVGVIVHAPDTSIIMNNPKASELFSLTDEQLRGLQAIDPELNFLDESKNIMAVEEYPVNKVISTKKQIKNRIVGIVKKNVTDVVWVIVNGFPIFNDKSEIIEIVISFIDITELQDKEEMMIAQSRQAAMGEMISMIAHQWRQPLSVISMEANNMLVDIELESLSQESVKMDSENILIQTEHLSKTIDDFRDFFRPNQEKEEIGLKSVIEDTRKIIGHSLSNNSISLSVDCSTEIVIFAHKRELIQVLMNLINNAKDALVEYIKVDREINIFINEDSENIIIKVCDNGGGIDENIREKIFEPYFTTKQEKNGTGLGLYMSKTIIEKHFLGHISVENHENGACFIISMPNKKF